MQKCLQSAEEVRWVLLLRIRSPEGNWSKRFGWIRMRFASLWSNYHRTTRTDSIQSLKRKHFSIEESPCGTIEWVLKPAVWLDLFGYSDWYHLQTGERRVIWLTIPRHLVSCQYECMESHSDRSSTQMVRCRDRLKMLSSKV